MAPTRKDKDPQPVEVSDSSDSTRSEWAETSTPLISFVDRSALSQTPHPKPPPLHIPNKPTALIRRKRPATTTQPKATETASRPSELPTPGGPDFVRQLLAYADDHGHRSLQDTYAVKVNGSFSLTRTQVYKKHGRLLASLRDDQTDLRTLQLDQISHQDFTLLTREDMLAVRLVAKLTDPTLATRFPANRLQFEEIWEDHIYKIPYQLSTWFRHVPLAAEELASQAKEPGTRHALQVLAHKAYSMIWDYETREDQTNRAVNDAVARLNSLVDLMQDKSKKGLAAKAMAVYDLVEEVKALTAVLAKKEDHEDRPAKRAKGKAS